MFTLTIVLVAIAAVIAAILLFAARKPDKFEIKRSATINAGSERIHPLLNDMRAHLKWSPFEKDPNARRTHSGAAQGPGAVYEWDGNRDVGAGRIELVDSTPSRITFDMRMSRPFACRNVIEYTLQPNGQGTLVTWEMRGPQPFMAKLMSTFIDCEKMVGREFDKGLANLKALAEA
jgi:hypothetical protein